MELSAWAATHVPGMQTGSADLPAKVDSEGSWLVRSAGGGGAADSAARWAVGACTGASVTSH